MTISRIQLGQEGEALADSFLKKQGYRILKRNFKNKLGEIDIIAQDRDILCFIEVKTRDSIRQGSPLESITRSKQRKLIRLALLYLKSHCHLKQKARFDVVSVTKDEAARPHICVIKNAFDLNDAGYVWDFTDPCNIKI